MTSTQRFEKYISLVLLFGMLLSALLVLLGGVLFLYQHATDSVTLLQSTNNTPTTFFTLWQSVISFTPLSIIEVGILLLVLTQIIRVSLITLLYLVIKDYVFVLISGFIFLVLLYSFLW